MSDELALMQARASLFRKKAAVMKALEGGMAKTGSNDHFNYKFVTASAIKQTVGALFADHGLSLQMSGVATENSVTEVELKNGSVKRVPILRLQFAIILCDVDTGALEQSFWFGEAEARDDKAASKAATSALKYYLISNLMIADKTEDKRDTDRDAGKRPRPAETKTQGSKPAWGDELNRILVESRIPDEEIKRAKVHAYKQFLADKLPHDTPIDEVYSEAVSIFHSDELIEEMD